MSNAAHLHISNRISKYSGIGLWALSLILISWDTAAQPIAGFNPSALEGCPGGVISLTNTSTGTSAGATYTWSSGGCGTIAAPQALSTSLTLPTSGCCTVTLTVTDGGNTASVSEDICVSPRPTAAFSVSTATVCQGGCVTFQDESTGQQPIVAWQWFAQGGTPANPPSVPAPQVCYNTLGCFPVGLAVTDALGCTSTITNVPNSVCVSEALSFTPTFTSNCEPPYSGTFAANAPGTDTWAWDFDGTGSSVAENPSHTFPGPGDYEITVTASGPGCSGSETFSISVGAAASADFTLPSSVCAGTQTAMTNTSPANSYAWTVTPAATFAGGTGPTSQNPVLVFPTAGTYTVSLVAQLSGNCEAQAAQTITVGDALTVDFTADSLEGCSAPLPVNFTPLVTGTANTYAWSFGAGGNPGTSTSANPPTVNFQMGNHTVSLTASNNGCSVTETKPAYISVSPALAGFDTLFFDHCVPSAVQFMDTANPDVPIVSWNWDFGDGGTSTQQNPEHTYTDPGVYTVTLVAVNAIGCTTTVTRPGMIQVNDAPILDFEVSDTLVCPGQQVCFTNLSTGTVGNPLWEWHFYDGWFSYSNQESPCYSYSDTGYHDVRLDVINGGCLRTLIMEDVVRVHPPKLNFTMNRECSNPLEVEVTVSPDAPDAYEHVSSFYWNFGNGPMGHDNPTFTYTYPQEGMYDVTLHVTNDSLNCSNSTWETITVCNPFATFLPSETVTCPGQVCFTDFPMECVDSLGWNFGDESDTLWVYPYDIWWWMDGAICHEYTDPGVYTVSLVLSKSGMLNCFDTLVMENLIEILGVGQAAEFSYAGVDVCDNQNFQVQFTDESPDGEVMGWSWYVLQPGLFGFDTVLISQEQHPLVTFTDYDGEEFVVLTILDNSGCSSSVMHVVDIPPAQETLVDASAAVACRSDVVTFTATPSAPDQIASLSWDFGDSGGVYSTIPPDFNASHAYSVNGSFDVTLTVTSLSGCVSTVVTESMVTVDDPVAQFTASPVYTFCPSVYVEFVNNSSGSLNTYNWDFGDGNTDVTTLDGIYPYYYEQFGLYDACLIAENSAGCRDTFCIDNVLDPCGALGPFSMEQDTANCTPFGIHFEAFNANDVCYGYQWDFGDGNSTAGSTTPMHIYETPGSYTVTLTMVNEINSQCIWDVSEVVEVGEITMAVSPEQVLCRGDSVMVTAEVTVDGGLPAHYQYHWTSGHELSDSVVSNPLAFPDSTVWLIVTGSYSDCTVTDSVLVSVNQLPLVSHSATDAVCHGDEPFQLTGGVPQGGSYSGVNVSDGIFSPLTALPGCDTVTYSIMDDNQCENTDTFCITVNPLPDVTFAQPDSLCHAAPAMVLEGGLPLDGVYSGIHVSDGQFDPETVGEHEVTYTFTDTMGCIQSAVRWVTVHPLPESSFGFDDVCLGDTVKVLNTSTIAQGEISSSVWTIDGAVVDSTSDPSDLLFPTVGEYVIGLVSTSEHGCVNGVSDTVEIHPLPVAAFSVETVCLTETSQFVDASQPPEGYTLSWSWDFGDDSGTGDQQHPDNLFSVADTFVVTMQVTTDFGCVDSATGQAVVHPLPIVDFTHADQCFGVPVTFVNNSSIPSGSIVGHDWHFGEEQQGSAEAAPVHLYGEYGEYQVSLTVLSALGCADSLTRTVEIYPLPIPDFMVYPDSFGCEPLEVVLLDLSTVPLPRQIVQWNWSLGDGSTTQEPQPEHVYVTHGFYDVGLTVVTSDGCTDSTFQPNAIAVHPNPIAGFSTAPERISIFVPQVSVTDQSVGSSEWHYDFGDLMSSELQNPVHRYSDTASYLIRQVVFNEFGCTDTAFNLVTVEPEFTLYVPNTFTPNNDGKNESFNANGYGIRDFNMRITNRWGQQVFESNSIKLGWNGSVNGRAAQQGVYVYDINVRWVDGSVAQRIGKVTLVR